MPEIIMVRHGQASANFIQDADPGLSGLGRAQAREIAGVLKGLSGYKLFTSPLQRARETADPLAAVWKVDPIVEPRVSEVPSDGVSLAERGEWLMQIMSSRWSDVEDRQRAWRDELLECLLTADTPRIYFSHFIAINVAVGAATGDDRVVNTRPKNTSVFRLSSEGSSVSILERGRCDEG